MRSAARTLDAFTVASKKADRVVVEAAENALMLQVARLCEPAELRAQLDHLVEVSTRRTWTGPTPPAWTSTTCNSRW